MTGFQVMCIAILAFIALCVLVSVLPKRWAAYLVVWGLCLAAVGFLALLVLGAFGVIP